MVSGRPVPNDRPSREIRSRRARIHSHIPGSNIYYVTFNSGGLPEPAEYAGLGTLQRSQSVLVSAEAELSKWWITL